MIAIGGLQSGRLARCAAIAACITLLGLVPLLSFGSTAPGVDWVGVAFGLGSALCFASYNVVAEHELKRTDPVTMGTGVLLTLAVVMAIAFGNRSYPRDPLLWGYAVLLGVFCGFVPYLFFLQGIRRIGAARAGVVNSVGPALTLGWAALFLDERLNGGQLLGAAIVLGGVISLRLKSMRLGIGALWSGAIRLQKGLALALAPRNRAE